MTPERRDRIERMSKPLALLTAGAVIVCDLVPFVVLTVAALIVGATTGEQPAHNGFAPDGAFPAFDPQLWLTWGPVFCLAAWILVTFPVPLSRPGIFGRGMQLGFALLAILATAPRVLGFHNAPGIADAASLAVFPALAGLAALVLARMVLGALGALPRSWRQYLDAAGNRVRPAPMDTRRPPLAEVPQ